MADPNDDPDKLPEAEAEERFRRLVGNLVKTPHKPHKVPASERAREKSRKA